MKYYSEILNKFFDSEAKCQSAEKEHADAQKAEQEKKTALANQRADRAKEIERLYKQAVDAKKAYDKELKSFLKDYHSYHYSITGDNWVDDIFGWFF